MYRVDYLVGWTGNQNIQITPDDLLKYIIAEGGVVLSVNGMIGDVVLVPEHLGLGNVDNTRDIDKHVLSATRLDPGATINNVLFNGSDPIIIYDHTKLSLEGGTLLGNVMLIANPTHPLHLVTKEYVDSLFRSNASIFKSNIELVGEIGEIIVIEKNHTTIPSNHDVSSGQVLIADAGFNGVGSGGNIALVESFAESLTYSEVILGDGINSSFIVSHNLDTSVIDASMINTSVGVEIFDFDVNIINNNSVEISFIGTPDVGDNFLITISKRFSHSETVQGNGVDSDFVITHNLNVPSVQASLTTLNGVEVVSFNVTSIDNNSAQISFSTPPNDGEVFLVSVFNAVEEINVRIISRSDRGGGGTGGGSVPDYENMWSTNQISAPDESWTVTEDGHVWLGTRLRKAEDCVWTINEQIVMDHSSAVGGKTDGFFDVLQGDVIKCVSAPDTTGVFCYFIPPRGGSGGSGGTPGPQGPPGPAGPQGEPGPPGTGTGIDFIDTFTELIALPTSTSPLKSMYLVKDASADPNVTGDVWALYIRVGEDGTASDWLKIADGGVVTGVGGGHCVPDYENMGTTNLISESGESWTATQNGYVLLGTELRMFEDCVWTINDATVMDHASAVGGKTDNMFAVKQGDIVKCVSEQDTSGVFCFFIPATDSGDSGGSSCVCVHQCSNPNILDNWDWLGNNLVNQQGQMSYESQPIRRYTIDRWITDGNAVYVESNGVRVATPGVLSNFYQIIESPIGYLGSTYTASVMVDNEIHSFQANLPNILTPGIYGVYADPGFNFNVHITHALNLVFAINVAVGESIVFQAVKLEQGNVSTLANDPPMKFGRELAICQRYFWTPNADMPENGSSNSSLGINCDFVYYGLNHVAIDGVGGGGGAHTIVFPVEMRIPPTCTFYGNSLGYWLENVDNDINFIEMDVLHRDTKKIVLNGPGMGFDAITYRQGGLVLDANL